MTPPGARRIIGLDVLRCAAIGAVLLTHGFPFLYSWVPSVTLPGGWTFHLYHLGQLGGCGVELFFVLSGFLIGRILLEVGPRLAEGSELFRFYARRWFRTLPNYYLFLAVNLAFLLWVFPEPVPWSRIPRYLAFLQTFTANRAVFFPESWSLCIEEWFYLLFPLLVALALRLCRRVSVAFLTVGLVMYLASTAGRFGYAAAHPAYTWAVDLREIVVVRFDAVMTGVLAAWVLWRFPSAFGRAPRLTALAGLVLLCWCYGTFYSHGGDNETLFARTVRFNLFSLGFALLLPAANRLRATRFGWFNAATEALARWSYSMYLVQLPLSWLIRARWFPRYDSSRAQGYVAYLTLVAGTVLISAAVYTAYERPVMKLRDRFSFSRVNPRAGHQPIVVQPQ